MASGVRKKALKENPLHYLVMMICYKLKKTEAEVAEWDLDTLYRWVAFFNLKTEAEKKAYADAQRNRGRK